MTAFRLALAAYVVALLIYTGIVIANHGMNLLPVFFGDIAKMEWPGQFNFDFMGFILLTAFWIVWRNGFTPFSFLLALGAPAGGIGFTSIYLIYLSYQTNGDVKAMLMGVNAR
jgi:hypothetical protein